MREIRFRAWDKEKKKMIFSGLEFELRRLNLDYRREKTIEEACIGYNENDFKCFEMMQFTGLKDNGGLDIYEGDIIVKPDEYIWYLKDGTPNYVGVVEWYYSSWQVTPNSVNKNNRGSAFGCSLNEDGVEENCNSDWLVLGNIYETPELLEQKSWSKNEKQ